MTRRWRKFRKSLVRAVLPVLRALPPRVASRSLGLLGRIEHALIPTLRRQHDDAARRWAEHLGCQWDVSAVSRSLASNEVRWQARDLLLDGPDDRRSIPLVHVSGLDRLEAALAAGRGVVLLANHFGSHMIPAHWLLRRGYELRLYMERPNHVSRFMARHFATDGPLGQAKLLISRKRASTADAAGSILRAVKVLKAGMILCLAGDVRWTGSNTAPARFLGRQHTFTATWVILAALTGAPVVPVFCRIAPDGTYDLEFRPSFEVPANVVSAGEVARYVQGCLDAIEEQLRLDPANGNEYVWWSDADLQPAA
jgi:KDO2-lipid IV(A) lauroyltransferase